MANILKMVDEAVKKNLADKKANYFPYDGMVITMYRYFDGEAPDIRVQFIDDEYIPVENLLRLTARVYRDLCDHSLSFYEDHGINVEIGSNYFEIRFYNRRN